jgi:hypothetical protein
MIRVSGFGESQASGMSSEDFDGRNPQRRGSGREAGLSKPALQGEPNEPELNPEPPPNEPASLQRSAPYARLKRDNAARLKGEIPRKWRISHNHPVQKTGVAGIEPCHAQSNEKLTCFYLVEL